MMLRKFLIAAGIAAASTAITAPANAATYLDIHDFGDSDSFGNSNNYFRGFTDYYFFNVSQVGWINGTITSLASLPGLDVNLMKISLDGWSLDRVSGGSLEKWTFNNMRVQPGNHKLSVTGYWGKEGGSYSGFLSYTAAAVPEPANWAMMIAGFGIVGAAMRRRARTKVRYA